MNKLFKCPVCSAIEKQSYEDILDIDDCFEDKIVKSILAIVPHVIPTLFGKKNILLPVVITLKK